MKKSIHILAVAMLASFGVKAQDFLIGGGVSYGTFRETLGFDFRGDLRRGDAINRVYTVFGGYYYLWPPPETNAYVYKNTKRGCLELSHAGAAWKN